MKALIAILIAAVIGLGVALAVVDERQRNRRDHRLHRGDELDVDDHAANNNQLDREHRNHDHELDPDDHRADDEYPGNDDGANHDHHRPRHGYRGERWRGAVGVVSVIDRCG